MQRPCLAMRGRAACFPDLGLGGWISPVGPFSLCPLGGKVTCPNGVSNFDYPNSVCERPN